MNAIGKIIRGLRRPAVAWPLLLATVWAMTVIFEVQYIGPELDVGLSRGQLSVWSGPRGGCGNGSVTESPGWHVRNAGVPRSQNLAWGLGLIAPNWYVPSVKSAYITLPVWMLAIPIAACLANQACRKRRERRAALSGNARPHRRNQVFWASTCGMLLIVLLLSTRFSLMAWLSDWTLMISGGRVETIRSPAAGNGGIRLEAISSDWRVLPQFTIEDTGTGSWMLECDIPIWMLLALSIGQVLWLTWCARCFRPAGHCPKCGYNLYKNTSGVCPECGTIVPAQTVSSNSTPTR